MTCKRDHWYLTAGGRELRLKARPPARLTCNPSLQKHTQSKDKETKTTAPSGNTPFGTTNHLQSPFRVTVTFGARGRDDRIVCVCGCNVRCRSRGTISFPGRD